MDQPSNSKAFDHGNYSRSKPAKDPNTKLTSSLQAKKDEEFVSSRQMMRKIDAKLRLIANHQTE